MKKLLYILLAVCCISSVFSCRDEETYADMKNKEKNAIKKFLKDNDFVGPITEISEAQFYAQDSITDTLKNEFVLFKEDGIYMQIVNRGEGKSMIEMAKEQSSDSTISKTIICRFLEYDIEGGSITYSNIYSAAIIDKMLCTYTHFGRSYKASFTEGYMKNYYESAVPKGWIKPLDYIRLTRNAGRIAKVRLIVPHSSGTGNAQGYVLPMYYEISYQLGI